MEGSRILVRADPDWIRGPGLHGRIQSSQKNHPFRGRIHRRDEQSVVTAGVRPTRSSRRIAANAVGEQPFAAFRDREVAALLLVECIAHGVAGKWSLTR